MVVALVLFALIALAGVIGSVVVLGRDGYRRQPTRGPAGWYQATSPTDANASS